MNYRILFYLVMIFLLVGTASADTLITNVAHDGYVLEGTDAAWETIARDVGENAVDGGVRIYGQTLATVTTDVQSYHRRAVVVFNGSIIPDDDTIDSVTVSVYGHSKSNAQGTVNASLIDTSPANPMDLVAGDYDATTFTRQANDIPYASFSTTAYNNWTLTNLSSVSKTGLFSYMLTHSADVDLSALTWASSGVSGFTYIATDTGVHPPLITITYTPGGATPPVASFTLSKNYIRIPGTVTATDTSTNTPTSWQWSWGDGSANSTTQNPSHQYLKRGAFNISMTATNTGGSGTTEATSVRVVGYENYY